MEVGSGAWLDKAVSSLVLTGRGGVLQALPLMHVLPEIYLVWVLDNGESRV